MEERLRNCLGNYVFSADGFFFGFPVLSVFPCYLQHVGAGSCHFNGMCNILEFRTSHFPLYLHHFGAPSVHVAWYFATKVKGWFGGCLGRVWLLVVFTVVLWGSFRVGLGFIWGLV